MIGYPLFFKAAPLFYQPLPFYGKTFNPSFWENFENSTPISPFIKVGFQK